MKDKFENKLYNLAKEINVLLNEEQLNQFYEYMNLLIEWNKKINLTAITEEDDIILKHFIDSMTVFKHLGGSRKIVDVGTGAGFPGIPISIVNEEKQVTLVDSLNKRINFLNDVKEKIKLKNIVTIHSRAEDLGQNDLYREKYDVAISRAVANLATLTEYLLPLVNVGGICVCMKGHDVEEELKKSSKAIEVLGGKLELAHEFYLPASDMKRNVIVIRKVKHTNKKYPRKAGIPSKEPLI